MATLPITRLVLPTDLNGVENGNLPPDLLTVVGEAGWLHHLAARAFAAMRAVAPFPLCWTYGGTYRTYQQQVNLFKSRYSPDGAFGGCKTWNGERWCLKGNYASAAVPGTSNHGLGLAVDAAVGSGPSSCRSVNVTEIQWLADYEHLYGFSHELQSEAWHIRYVAGDNLPAAVLAHERGPLPPPTTPPVTIPIGDDDMLIAVRAIADDATFISNGVQKCWVADPVALNHLLDTMRASGRPVLDFTGKPLQNNAAAPEMFPGGMRGFGTVVGQMPPGNRDAWGVLV